MRPFSGWNGIAIITCYSPLLALYIGSFHLLLVTDGLSTPAHSSALLLLMEPFHMRPGARLLPSECSTEVGELDCKQCRGKT